MGKLRTWGFGFMAVGLSGDGSAAWGRVRVEREMIGLRSVGLSKKK